MSNLVLNDDSVMCHYCYDEYAGSDPIWEASAEALIMGSTTYFPCCICDDEIQQETDHVQSIQ